MPKDKAPEFLPASVESAYLDGCAFLNQKRWTAAAGAFRTAIDRTTRLLWIDVPNADGEIPFNLGKRIKKLAAHLVIPNALVDWADVVRGVGNEMHAIEEVGNVDAKDAGHFAEVFLTYVYTLPQRLVDFRKRRDSESDNLESPS